MNQKSTLRHWNLTFQIINQGGGQNQEAYNNYYSEYNNQEAYNYYYSEYNNQDYSDNYAGNYDQ